MNAFCKTCGVTYALTADNRCPNCNSKIAAPRFGLHVKQVMWGAFFVIGALLAGGLRIAGIRPTGSNTSYSRGSDEGFWIGTGVGIIVGLSLIAKGLIARKADSKSDDNRLLVERLSTIEISNTTYAIVLIIVAIVAMSIWQLVGGGR